MKIYLDHDPTEGRRLPTEEELLELRQQLIDLVPKEVTFPKLNPEWRFTYELVMKYLWYEDAYYINRSKFFEEVMDCKKGFTNQ